MSLHNSFLALLAQELNTRRRQMILNYRRFSETLTLRYLGRRDQPPSRLCPETPHSTNKISFGSAVLLRVCTQGSLLQTENMMTYANRPEHADTLRKKT